MIRHWWFSLGALLVIAAHQMHLHIVVKRTALGTRLLCEPFHDWGND